MIGGTKWPSMTSTWISRAPAAMTSATWAPEPREVGGEDRGRDSPGREQLGDAGLSAPVHQIGLSIELPQCWQSMSSEVLMRTIVWCSPQFGHCETSS